jgi:NAD(P)-dependent dehydrogenase (short-subunit alcohol dehydrogenase family)
MSIERKVAVITGASQGIGAGLVRGFLDRGYFYSRSNSAAAIVHEPLVTNV